MQEDHRGRQNVILKTERLVLRDYRASDWPAVFAYQSKPLYLRYYDSSERTPEDAREFVQMFLDQQQEDPRLKFQFAVILGSTGRLIGSCGIRMRSTAARAADIGYELAPSCWGQGYATEAAQTIVEFGFTQLHLHRIWSWCIAENVGSARVLEKLGMRREGRLRQNEYFKGRWWDTLLYGVLENEWREQQELKPKD